MLNGFACVIVIVFSLAVTFFVAVSSFSARGASVSEAAVSSATCAFLPEFEATVEWTFLLLMGVVACKKGRPVTSFDLETCE